MSRTYLNGFCDLVCSKLSGRARPALCPCRRKSPNPIPATGVLNAPAIVSWSPLLADRIGKVLDNGEFPVVLGGDCTILMGAMLALKRRGRYGLMFIDGHADFFQPEAEPNGEGASMELAWATRIRA